MVFGPFVERSPYSTYASTCYKCSFVNIVILILLSCGLDYCLKAEAEGQEQEVSQLFGVLLPHNWGY